MFLESSPGFQLSSSTRRRNQFLAVFILTIATVFSIGCAGIASGAPSPSASQAVHISLMPGSASVVAGGKVQFAATLTSTSNTAVVWHASAGTISGTGLFTAPSVSLSTKVTVTVVSAADSTLIATSDVTVAPLINLAMQLHPLLGGIAGTPYSANLTVTGGVAPYDWQIAGGALPQGFSLDRASGVIAGITSQTGNFNFTVSVTDSNSAKVSGSLGLKIGTSTSGNFDGPAELPRVYVQTDLAHTPAPGTTISVPKGGDFQQALDRANCGDTIALQAGGVYTGQFRLPSKNCDDNHWIIVRTSAPNSNLPAESTRISPCSAGVASLPGRPSFNCISTTNVMAKVQAGGTGYTTLVFGNGANHYRFIGLEITRTPGSGVVYNLAVREKGGASDHIIFDRCWIHGTAQDETQRGVMMTGTRYIAVIDSYLSDFHCQAMGACIDSQAIAGGLGELPMGPLKIVNNFLEAAGENILLGGDAATTSPTDIEIRHNHLFKPMIWKRGQPDFVGARDGNPFVIKALFELKSANRLLFEGNILDNDWGGFSQHGAAIGLGPKNQDIGNTNVCPLCVVTDITIRYVKISHVAGGLVLGNGLSVDGGAALDGGRYSIHDVTVDDIDPIKYEGSGVFAQVSTGRGAPLLHDVTINHVTAFAPVIMLNIGNWVSTNGRMRNFVYTNNLANAGKGPTSTTGGGPGNCAYPGKPIVVLAACFQNYTFSRNAVLGTPSYDPPEMYPADNFFPASAASVDFVNYSNGNGGDYHLQSHSRYKNAGIDGKDLGADIDALQAATAGAE
jgi:hypothetical protein